MLSLPPRIDPQLHDEVLDLRRQVHEQLRLIAERDAQIRSRDREIVYKDAKIAALTHELARHKRWVFAARSEKLDPSQRALFEDAAAEDLAAIETELAALQASAAKTKTQPRREALPAHLPRIETRLEPESCQCTACGAALTCIGEEVSEQLDCKPIEFFVRRTVRGKYACRACETLTTAPLPPAIIERGQPAPGLLAQVLVAKYADHEPLYRQCEIYRRSGVDLARSTLADWIGACGVALAPLAAALKAELLTLPVLHADETPVAQLDPGAGKTKRAYLFTYRSADPKADITVFDYCESRSGEHARRFLGDWRGALMVDDFAGYKALFPAITELGCWAHARRKFFELVEAQASPHAHEILEPIAHLYRIEDEARGLDPPQRRQYRREHAAPILEQIRKWMTDLRPKVLNNSGLARALDYTDKRWAALVRYLDDGGYPIDNNPVENAIRPVALGRKNWLFAGSPRAGQRAAVIMSLIATAKQNGHEPYAYLKDVLARLPITKDRDIATLLPHRWQSIS